MSHAAPTAPVKASEVGSSTAPAEFKPAFIPDAPTTELLSPPSGDETPITPLKVSEAADYTKSWKRERLEQGESTEMYQNLRAIERDSAITGGVSTGRYKAEAIAVDNVDIPLKNTDPHPEVFQKVLDAAYARLETLDDSQPADLQMLFAIYQTVLETMQYSPGGTNYVLREFAKSVEKRTMKDQSVIPLSQFIEAGVGVCRHQALTVGALAEMAEVDGDVSYDRNENWLADGDPSGHAWIRYTDKNGEVYIIDVAQKYFGKLIDTLDMPTWSYFRDSQEKQMFVELKAARESVNNSFEVESFAPAAETKARVPEKIEKALSIYDQVVEQKTNPDGEPLSPADRDVIIGMSHTLLTHVLNQFDRDVELTEYDSIAGEKTANELADVFRSVSGHVIRRLYDQNTITSVDDKKKWLKQVVNTIYDFKFPEPHMQYEIAKVQAYTARVLANSLISQV